MWKHIARVDDFGPLLHSSEGLRQALEMISDNRILVMEEAFGPVFRNVIKTFVDSYTAALAGDALDILRISSIGNEEDMSCICSIAIELYNHLGSRNY